MVHTLPDFTGNGTTQPLAVTRMMANWIQFTVPLAPNGSTTTNSAAVRVGDQFVSPTRGTQVTIFGMLFPATSDSASLDLSQIYFYAATGDKLQVTYGKL